VRPGEFEHRFVFLWVERVASGIDWRGYGAEKVGCELGGEFNLRDQIREG
jgi:hypothetical protein